MPLIKANVGANSNFEIPTLIKTVAANSDYFIGVDAEGLLYKISKSDLLAGLTSGTGGSGTGGSGTGGSGTGGSGTGGTGTGGSGTGGTDPYFSNVVVLLHFDGVNSSTTFTDVKGHIFTPNGSTLNTSQFKYGTASGQFIPNNFISTSNNSDFDFNSSSTFTIEAWIYRLVSGVTHAICGKLPQIASQGFSFHIKSNDNLAIESDGAAPNIDSGLKLLRNYQYIYKS